MTIYDCLGIEEFLINETIPLDMIIENIDNFNLRRDADVFFRDISRVSIRASLNRGNHFMQVVEVELNSADHISEISLLIQKAIRYQVLFVFVYDDRYLILRRSFNLTMSTEHVYSDHISFCTDWIYKEHLEDDLVAMFDTEEVTDYYNDEFELPNEPKKTKIDNGDHYYFDDIIRNAARLNKSVTECDVVCLRFLQDWFGLHAAGWRISIYDVLDKVRQEETHQMIGDHLFVEKDSVRYAIGDLENSFYLVSLDHTGKVPVLYYNNIRDLSTYADAYKLMVYVLQDNDELLEDEYDEESDVYKELPKDVKKYVNITNPGVLMSVPIYREPRLKFVDDIIRRHRFRGYHLIEDQGLGQMLVRRLRFKGYQALEQFSSESIESIDFLSKAMQLELILCMDKRGFRFEECSKDEYPSIYDYFKTHYTCSLCDEPLEGVQLIGGKCICNKCMVRLEHLEEEKPFTVESDHIVWDDDTLTTKFTSVFTLVENDIFDLSETLELTDAYTFLNNGQIYRSSSFVLIPVNIYDENSELSVLWTSDDADFNSVNAMYIHLVFKEKNMGNFFLFVFKFDKNKNLQLYDYIKELDYSAYKAERARQELDIVLSTIQDNLYDRLSVETCLEYISFPEVKALFEGYYIVENGIYYSHDKTHLVMCEDCDYIESIVVPESVEIIGRSAFRGVKEIGSITFPNNLRKIAPTAFLRVSFRKDIILPNSITEIGNRAFFKVNTPSDSINIPAMLETLGRDAFPLWWSLHYSVTGVYLSEAIKELLFTSNYEVVFGEEQIPAIIESGSSWDFSWEVNSANELYITAQGAFAPYRWDSDKDTEWRKYARRIRKLIFSHGITSVAGSAFEGCDNISEVVFPSTLQYLDVRTLKNTIWYENFKSKYTVVGDECLIKVITDDCILEIPDNIKYISRITDSFFSNKLSPNLRHIIFGCGVHTLLPFAFDGSSIETVIFNDGLVEICQQALASCRGLEFLCLPNSVKTIGYGAFSYSTSLRCVVLSGNLESIESNAFNGCFNLEKIIVPLDKDEFKKKIKPCFGVDGFPYNKCIYSTTTDDRKITKESELITRRSTKQERCPTALSNYSVIGERLARTLRTYGIYTIDNLRNWGAKGVWEYVYKRERYPHLSFNSLVKLVLAEEDISEISKEKLVELYDFADSVVGYKLERKLLIDSQIDEESENLKRLPNIGSAMHSRLRSVGITTVADLMQTETEVIWDKLYAKKSTTHYLEIFSIEGAKKGIKIEELDTKCKDELKLYVDRKKGKIIKDPEDITTLPNIGVVMASRLIAAGISTTTILDSKTSEDIWDELYRIDPTVDLIEIFAIEGAKQRIKMGDIYFKRKNVLKRYVRAKKAQGK